MQIPDNQGLPPPHDPEDDTDRDKGLANIQDGVIKYDDEYDDYIQPEELP